MNTETLHPVTDYLSELFNFLDIAEGFKNGEPYFDTAKTPKATIGYGFNVEVTDYLLLVLRELGIVNGAMTATQINAIRTAFTNKINNTPDGNDPTLVTNLNQLAQQYGVSTGFKIVSWSGKTRQ